MGALAPCAITTDDLAWLHALSRDQLIELVFELSRNLEFLRQAIEGRFEPDRRTPRPEPPAMARYGNSTELSRPSHQTQALIRGDAGTAFVVAEFRADENAEAHPLYSDPIVAHARSTCNAMRAGLDLT